MSPRETSTSHVGVTVVGQDPEGVVLDRLDHERPILGGSTGRRGLPARFIRSRIGRRSVRVPEAGWRGRRVLERRIDKLVADLAEHDATHNPPRRHTATLLEQILGPRPSTGGTAAVHRDGLEGYRAALDAGTAPDPETVDAILAGQREPATQPRRRRQELDIA